MISSTHLNITFFANFLPMLIIVQRSLSARETHLEERKLPEEYTLKHGGCKNAATSINSLTLNLNRNISNNICVTRKKEIARNALPGMLVNIYFQIPQIFINNFSLLYFYHESSILSFR